MSTYKSYHSSITMKYKRGYIFTAVIDGHQVTKFTVDAYTYIQYAKSVHAAKLAISKHDKKVG